MYINSNHLKIAKFISNTSNFNYKSLSDFLNIANYTLTNYLKDIECIITQNKACLNFDEIIELIKNKKNVISLLKKEQYITKEEKKDYILFLLLDNKNVNLANLAETLKVSRRSLNYYLDDLKDFLNVENIFIKKYSNTGISLEGDDFNKKKLLFALCIKFLIEKNEAPKEIRHIIKKILCTINYSTIIKKIKLYRINTENIIFLDNNTFIPYLYVTGNYLHENVEFIYKEYNNFVNKIMAITTAVVSNFDKNIKEYFNLSKNNDPFFKDSLKKWLAYNIFKNKYKVNDLTMSCKIINEFPSDILNFREHLKNNQINLGLYEAIGIYFLVKESQYANLKSSIKHILVYKNIPECTLLIAKTKLEKIYNFNFISIVHYKDLNNFLKNDISTSIVCVENLNFSYLKNNYIYIPLFSLI